MEKVFETAFWCLLWVFGAFAVLKVLFIDTTTNLEEAFFNSRPKNEKWFFFLKCTAGIVGFIILSWGIRETLSFLPKSFGYFNEDNHWCEYRLGIALCGAFIIVGRLNGILEKYRETQFKLLECTIDDDARKKICEISALAPQEQKEKLTQLEDEVSQMLENATFDRCYYVKYRVLDHYGSNILNNNV